MKGKKLLLLSGLVILVYLSLMVGMTYALFTDSVSVKQHLQAGTLDVKLSRTNLKYCILNKDGYLEENEIGDDEDFTALNDENIFGIAKDSLIAPGSFFEAELKLTNNGNVAFNYNVLMKLNTEANDLAKQLKVTITHADGKTTTAMMSELTNGIGIETGEMAKDATSNTFKVRVEFVNDFDYNQTIEEDYINNNNAQSKSIIFDLIVIATQATK